MMKTNNPLKNDAAQPYLRKSILRPSVILLRGIIPLIFFAILQNGFSQTNSSINPSGTGNASKVDKQFIIHYYLGIKKKDDQLSIFEPVVEPYGEIYPTDRFRLESYCAVFYSFPEYRMEKAQCYFKNEHLQTYYFNKKQQQISTKDYMGFYRNWNGLHRKPVQESEISYKELAYHFEYYKVYYVYPKEKSDAIVQGFQHFIDQKPIQKCSFLYSKDDSKIIHELHTSDQEIVVSSVQYSFDERGSINGATVVDPKITEKKDFVIREIKK